MPASSTTRPVSAGNVSVCATTLDAKTRSAIRDPRTPRRSEARACLALNSMAARRSTDPGPGSELHLRRAPHVLGDREGLHRLLAAIEGARPDHAGKRPQLGVVGAHRL